MPRGGARPGAGRPTGGKDRTAEAKVVIDKHVQSMCQIDIPEHIARMSPLQIMLHAMSLEASQERWPQAAALAKEAAPYLHPKLSNVEMSANVRRSPEDYTDAELAALAGPGWSDEGDEAAPEGA